MIKLYVYDFNYDQNVSDFNAMSDEDLINRAEIDGMVFTLKDFQAACNAEELSLNNAMFRFIEVEI